MIRRIFALCLSGALLLGMLASGALAAEADTYLIEAEDAAGTETADEEAGEDEALVMTAETEESAEPAAEDTADEPEPAAEAEESAGEEAEAVAETAAESVYGGLSELDPEDPLYAQYVLDGGIMELQLDGTTHSDFVPRVLSGETIRLGIDVSAWQGTIDWEAVAAAGVEFVIIRGAYRGVNTGVLAKDSMFTTYIKGALAAGLLVGVYVYSQAITEEEAREEADYLIELVQGYDIDLPLVLDYEYYGTSGRLYNAKLSKRAATDICKAFCDEVEQSGYDSMVYANPSMLNGSLYASELGRVWLAHYTTETTYSGSYEYWQCGVGSVSGVSGTVDLDFWFDTSTEVSGDVFDDVGESDWFYQVVMDAYEAGIVKGITTTSFGPKQTASRGQVITMIYRMMGEPAVSSTAGFTDLTSDYYKDAVNWAAANGVVTGYSDTEFGPNKAISREELAAVLYRMAGSPDTTGDLSGYSDAEDIHSYAQSAMAWAVETGILTGYEDSTLRPQGKASRAEVCAMIMRYDALA